MIPADEDFDGTWPFAPHFSTASGFRQHYVDEGPRDAEVILCLHGEPTWGYLYRKFIPPLARDYRVIVPDHMGFGKSETPQDQTYTLQTHVENLERLIDDLKLENITFVCQDWGGPITGAYTIRHPERVRRLFLMNTLFGYGGTPPPAEKTPWFQWIEKHEEAGTLRGILGELGSTVLSVMKIIGFQNSSAVDETWLRAYSAQFPDRDSCIGGIEFPLDVHYGRMRPYILDGLQQGNLEAVRAKPAFLASGDMDFGIAAEHARADFRALFPDAPIVPLPGVGHFCQEDVPDTLVALIQGFMQTHR
ncbi:MAG: alpha/beta fold hydrolase [Pseudomonadota bacterium]